MAIETAFLLCGGKGERLKPLTDNLPKPLVEINGRPILEWLIDELAEQGVKHFVLGTGHLGDKVRKHFGDGKQMGVKISYSQEKEQLGTAGAMKLAAKFLQDRFIMLNGDNLLDINFNKMNELHDENSAIGTIAVHPVHDVSGFGVVELNGSRILRFVEKPKPGETKSNLISCGAYILEPEVIKMVPKGFSPEPARLAQAKHVAAATFSQGFFQQKKGFSMIEKDVFPKLAEFGKLFAYVHTGKWFPTDDHHRLNKAKEGWARK